MAETPDYGTEAHKIKNYLKDKGFYCIILVGNEQYAAVDFSARGYHFLTMLEFILKQYPEILVNAEEIIEKAKMEQQDNG